jgi:hypothetical protein
MSLALQNVLKVRECGRKWKRGVMRDNTYITEIKRACFMVLNIPKQSPPVFLVQVGLKRGKLPRRERGKMKQSGVFRISCRGKQLSCYCTGGWLLTLTV